MRLVASAVASLMTLSCVAHAQSDMPPMTMQLTNTYSIPLGDGSSAYLHAGAPALGQSAFTQRVSGTDDPAQPIAHHWLDAGQVDPGVVTAGLASDDWKLEGSLFNGREPDAFRWGFDPLKLDSATGRLSWNPDPNWVFQVSYGFLKSPEQLEPLTNEHPTTASAKYDLPLAHGNWQTTFALGRNSLQPGPDVDGMLVESAMTWYQHAFFARAEYAPKNDLFRPPGPLAEDKFSASGFSLGYAYDTPVADHVKLGFGAMGTANAFPGSVLPAYGSTPLSYTLFTRLKLE